MAATGSDHPAVPPPIKGSAKALAPTVSAEDNTACIKLRRLAASLAASPADKPKLFNLLVKTWLSYKKYSFYPSDVERSKNDFKKHVKFC